MFIPVGLALGALSTVSSLVGTAASSLAKAGGDDQLTALAQAFTGEQPQQKPASGKLAAGPLDTGTLAALIALQGQNGAGHAGLFGKLDADGNGVVDKSELESALAPAGVDKTSADAAFNTLDADGDGAISKSELKKVASGYHSHHQQHDAAGQRPLDQLMNSFRMNASQSQTSVNADGSTTTTITYADGRTVTTTTAATGHGNLLEQLIRLQAAVTSPGSGSSGTVA